MNDHDQRHPYDGLDDDAIFADIIAHLNDDDASQGGQATPATSEDAAADDEATGGPNPGAADLHQGEQHQGEQPEGDPDRQPGSPPPDSPAVSDPPAVPTPQVWRAHEVVGEDEEHFEPLPVSPLPVGDLQFWAIIAGMVGGPLLLVYLVFFNRDASSYWTLTAIAMSVGGFILLISRLPREHEDDDDGARL